MNDTTLLHRQVHPVWIQQGRVTSQAFKPTPKDNKRLSVYDGDRINAADAWTHFTEDLRQQSIGVLAVTIAECSGIELPVEPDPEPFPEHVIICFDRCESKTQIKTKASQLKARAEKRGWQYEATAA